MLCFRFTGEAYHFVSYVPINGRLFELDGLKPFPTDHGPWKDNEDWTDKFHSIITHRLGIAAGDIRFNLMAVVPDKRLAITHKLNMLKTNRQIVVEALQQHFKLNHPGLTLKFETDPKKNVEDLNLLSEIKQNKIGKSIENLDSLASIEDVLDLATQNKVPKQVKTEKNSNVLLDQETKSSTLEKEEGISNRDCDSLERHNLSKMSQVITSAESDKSKPEILECPKTSEKVTDYSTPLTIQTSPAPSTSSTDTSSEIGSAFNSPTQTWGWNSGQNSPNSAKDFKKFVVIRVAIAGSDDSPTGRPKRDSGVRKVCLEAGALPKGWEKPYGPNVSGMKISPLALSNKLKSDVSGKTIETPHHTFAPKDLLALLKNLEGEISVCEGNLRDENEKRKKYKIDDCRRTYNYDEFICTFLSMLAQQGQLADLVQQHLMDQKKPGLQPPRPVVIKTSQKKLDSKSHSSKCRKGRNKHRKRK